MLVELEYAIAVQVEPLQRLELAQAAVVLQVEGEVGDVVFSKEQVDHCVSHVRPVTRQGAYLVSETKVKVLALTFNWIATQI